MPDPLAKVIPLLFQDVKNSRDGPSYLKDRIFRHYR